MDAPERLSSPEILRVLVVDDDKRFREYAAEPFRKRGDDVRTTADGLEALAMCLADPPDVVLTDIQMPRMDGWQLLRLLRARPELAGVPIIFLTALGGDAERLRGYQLGVDAYIPKPFSAEEMLVRVHRIVTRAKQMLPTFTDRTTLRGELDHVTPSSLYSIVELEKKTGLLLLLGPSVARVFLRDGRAVRAEIEGAPAREPVAVVLDTLGWTTGQFEFTPEKVDGPDLIKKALTSLILEHARIADERKR